MSLISVVIPYFKKKPYIYKTIKSVLEQSYTKIEIIIVYDDPEIDDLIYLKKIIKNNKKIRLYKNKKNFGAAKSRNLGIKLAKGDYIALLDSDDLWSKKKIELQISFMKKNNLLFSYTAYKIIDDTGCIGIREVKKSLNYDDLLKSCDIGLSTVIFHKSLKNFIVFPNLKTKEDYVVWLSLAKKNLEIKGLNKQLTSWRKVKNSLSDSIFQKIIDGYRVYKIYEGYSLFYSLYRLLILSYNFIINNIKESFFKKF
jgi:teichuronic acid biosynthesis glycosyltransferase TuaG